jgi:hypothetical protein
MMLATFEDIPVYHSERAVELFGRMAAENPSEGRHASRLATARSILEDARAYEQNESGGDLLSKISSVLELFLTTDLQLQVLRPLPKLEVP